MMRRRRNIKKGFSLVEVIVSTAIFSAVSAGVFSSVAQLSKGSVSIGNYVKMSEEGRMFLETFGREIRMADDITQIENQTVQVNVPYDTGDETVQYTFDVINLSLSRSDGSGDATILENVVDMELSYYDLHGNETNKLIEAKSVQIRLKLERSSSALTNTHRIISARYVMRNRAVAS